MVPIFRVPSRAVPTSAGAQSLTTLASVSIPGSTRWNERLQLFISNLDTTNALRLQTANGVDWLNIPANTVLTVETGDDLKLYNPSGSTVSYIVAELYDSRSGDTPGQIVARFFAQFQQAASAGGTGGAGIGSGGGSGGSGGSGGGTAGGGGGSARPF